VAKEKVAQKAGESSAKKAAYVHQKTREPSAKKAAYVHQKAGESSKKAAYGKDKGFITNEDSNCILSHCLAHFFRAWFFYGVILGGLHRCDRGTR
jgi:hypothetical protein